MATMVRARHRVPTQRRSQETVLQILDAAESLLCQVPLEFVTTTRIAKEAGLSIAALYNFFGNKECVFEALVERHLKRIRECLEVAVMLPVQRQMKSDRPGFNPIAFLENVIDTYIAYLDAHPAFRVLALGQLNRAGAPTKAASPMAGLTAVMRNFLVDRMRVPRSPDLDLSLRVLTEAGERLIAFSYEQRTEEMRARVVEQMKRMLTGYLFVR